MQRSCFIYFVYPTENLGISVSKKMDVSLEIVRKKPWRLRVSRIVIMRKTTKRSSEQIFINAINYQKNLDLCSSSEEQIFYFFIFSLDCFCFFTYLGDTLFHESPSAKDPHCRNLCQWNNTCFVICYCFFFFFKYSKTKSRVSVLILNYA